MLKFSVVGAGRIAQAHAEAFKYLDGGVLFGAFDIDDKTLTDFCKTYACKAFSDDLEMMQSSDVIIICTPNNLHFEYAAKAIILGKTVICEKPLTSLLSDGVVLSGLEKSTNGKCFVSFNYRHNKIIRSMLSDVSAGVIGKVDHVKLEFLKGSMLTKKMVGWRERGDTENTSGAMSDLGAHLLDLCQLFIGHEIDMSDIRCKLKTTVLSISDQLVNVDDDSYLYARTKGGEFIEIHTSKVERHRPHGLYIEITGSRGRLTYQTEMKDMYVRRVDGQVENIFVEGKLLIEDPLGEIYGWSDSFLFQLRDLIDSNGGLTGTIQDGLKVQSVISELSKKYNIEKELIAQDGKILKEFTAEIA